MHHATLVSRPDRDERLAKPLIRYGHDIQARAVERAELIRLGRSHDLGIDNPADAVQDVARRDRNGLASRLSLVLQHLLERDCQPERRDAGWARTLRGQRLQVDELLDEPPSPRAHLPTLSDKAFRQCRVAASNETDLAGSAISAPGPSSRDEVMTRPIAWPEP